MRRNTQALEAMYAKRGVQLQLLEAPDAPPTLYGVSIMGGGSQAQAHAHAQFVANITMAG